MITKLKAIFISICIIVSIGAFCCAAFWIEKSLSYSWAYEDMMKQTIREMVKPEYLIVEQDIE